MQKVQGTSGDKCWSLALSLLGSVLEHRVLDIGAGGGYFAKMLTDRHAQVIGCDILNQWQYPEIPFFTADLDGVLPFDDASFESVTIIEAINYIESAPRSIREVRRILAPGGKIVLTLPNCMSAESRWKFYSAGKYRWFPHPIYDGGDKARYADAGRDPIRISTLKFYLESSGFEVESIKFGGNKIKPLYIMLSLSIRFLMVVNNLLSKPSKRLPVFLSSLSSLIYCNVGICARKI